MDKQQAQARIEAIKAELVELEKVVHAVERPDLSIYPRGANKGKGRILEIYTTTSRGNPDSPGRYAPGEVLFLNVRSGHKHATLATIERDGDGDLVIRRAAKLAEPRIKELTGSDRLFDGEVLW